MVRAVVAFIILDVTVTSYALYRTYARVTPLTEKDRAHYDDL